MQASKSKIIEKLKQNDYDAFEIFYYEYLDYIHYIISMYIKDSDTIDDLTQEIFMKILEKIHLYDSKKSSLNTWIYTLAKNHTLNFIQSNSYKKVVLDEDIISRTKSNDELEYELTKMDLKNALTELEYHVLFLKVERRLKHDEIATILNISLDKSKKTYRRAIKIAKEVLK